MTIAVDNETGSPQAVTFTENLLTPTCSGGTLTTTFTQTVTCNTGLTNCLTVNGLQPGIWNHEIQTGSQQQYQKSLLIAADPNGAPNSLSWVAFNTVLTVDRTDDNDSAPAAQCPSPPGMHTCTLRQALLAGASVPGPLLVQFNPTVFPAGTPTTIQLTLSSSLPIAGLGMTVDGTDPDGNPTFPGDPYNRVVALPSSGATIVFSNQSAVLQGLFIQRPPLVNGATPGDIIRFDGSQGPAQQDVVSHCKIDGGGGALTAKSSGHDCISGVGGAGSTWSTADAVRDCEITFCPDKGVKATTLAYVTVADSWLHNNIGGGIQATLSGNVESDNNVIEDNGYNATTQIFFDANGISANGANGVVGSTTPDVPSIIHTSGNIIRNNSSRGISVRNLSVASITNDLVCGTTNSGTSGQNGIAVFNGAGSTGASATVRGTTAVYNGRNGATVMNDSTADFGAGTSQGDNAFTENATNNALGGYDLDNSTTSQAAISAVDNQWLGCKVDPTSCSADTSGTVSVQPPQPYQADAGTMPVHIDSFSPRKATANQLVRITGGGFDAIDSYPPGGNCTTTIQANNTCGSPIVGNCVQYESAAGVWTELSVQAVTPTSIVVRMPATFTCAQPVTVRVQRLDYAGATVIGAGTFCTNSQPPPWASSTAVVPPQTGTLNCERAVSSQLATLSRCLVRCHIKAANAALRGKPFDEDACESTDPARSCRARYDKATTKLIAKGTCPTCLGAAQQAALADQAETYADNLSGGLFCAGTTPLAGDGLGLAPPDASSLRCERALARHLSAFASCFSACQRETVVKTFNGQSFDEAACEYTDPKRSCLARYGRQTARLSASGLCPACLATADQASLADQVAGILTNASGGPFCSGTVPAP